MADENDAGKTDTSGGGLTLNDVVGEVSARPRGMHAMSLLSVFTAKGHASEDVQRLVRLALAQGALKVGPRLRLVTGAAVR